MYSITKKRLSLLLAPVLIASGILALSTGQASAAPNQNPCSRIYYSGTPAHPTTLQLYCNDGGTIFKRSGPFPNYVHVHRDGILVKSAIQVGYEGRIFYDSGNLSCYLIRDLRNPADSTFGRCFHN